MFRGFYNVESAPAPAGPWSVFATVADLQWAQTNLVSLRVPATNARAFYRVACLRPNPIGVWDYDGYDHQGVLVITGYLRIPSMSLLSSTPPVVYAFKAPGSFNTLVHRPTRFGGSALKSELDP